MSAIFHLQRYEKTHFGKESRGEWVDEVADAQIDSGAP